MKPVKSAPILHIWEPGQSEPGKPWRWKQHPVIAIRRSKGGCEVVSGSMRFTGYSHGRGGNHIGYWWEERLHFSENEADALSWVADRFPAAKDASADLAKLRAKRPDCREAARFERGDEEQHAWDVLDAYRQRMGEEAFATAEAEFHDVAKGLDAKGLRALERFIRRFAAGLLG